MSQSHDPQSVRSTIVELLAQALSRSPEALSAALDTDLEQLGMDSHHLMRCTLDVEARFEVRELSVADEALETPRSLIDALTAAVLAQL